MSENKIKYKFLIRDYKNREVGWLLDSYNRHCAKHDYLKEITNDVKRTIKNPGLKGMAKGIKTEELLTEKRLNKKGQQLYIKVIINYNCHPALIKTAILTEDTDNCIIVL